MKNKIDWKSLIDQEFGSLMEFMQSGSVPLPEVPLSQYDWLFLAIKEVGREGDGWSFPVAAQRLGVSRSVLYHWMEKGLENAAFGKVLKLSELSGISVDQLRQRCGAFKARRSSAVRVPSQSKRGRKMP